MQKKYGLLIVLLAVIGAQGCGMEQVDEGNRGVKLEWGKVVGDPLAPGLYFYNPVSSNILELSVRETKMEEATEVFTRDTQKVMITYAVTYFPEQAKIGYLYSQFGRDWDAKIVKQAVLGGLKDSVGQYIADDLVSKREAAKNSAEAEIRKNLAERFVTVTRLDFVNLDFDDQYEKAVEAKVTAIQRAAEAKNKTVQVEEEAKQKVMAAEADAKSMRIKSEALSQNKGLVDYEAIQKWDGQLPHIMLGGGSLPIINLEKLTGAKK